MFFHVITISLTCSGQFVSYSVFVLMMVLYARTFTISSPLGLGTGHGMAWSGSVLGLQSALARYGVTAHSEQVEMMIARQRKSCAHFILSLPTADLDTSAHKGALLRAQERTE